MVLGDGAVAYVMEMGGRLIGVYPTDDKDAINALWIDPDISSSLISHDNWNLGGDRLWQGAEFGSKECNESTFFCREPGNYDEWVCQPGIDPGRYVRKEMPSLSASVYLESRGKATDFKNGGHHPNILTRLFDPTKVIKPPNDGVTCANIDFMDTVTSTAPFFYAWKLVQIRAGDENNPGTVIYPCSSNPEIGVYMNEHGGELKELVRIGDDHVSIKTFETDTRYKLSIPPNSFRQTGPPDGKKHHSVMQVSKVPGGEDRYQLVAVHSYTCPRKPDDIFEVSSAKMEDLNGLGWNFTRKRGASYTYNGPTPAGGSWFTEQEMAGKGVRANEKSIVAGSMSFYWGSGEAIMDAAKSVAGTKDHPFVFGLNE